MAHLITLTGAVDGHEMLFNLDTVVSIEKGNNSTIIATRWAALWSGNPLKQLEKRRQLTKRLTLRPKWNKVI